MRRYWGLWMKPERLEKRPRRVGGPGHSPGERPGVASPAPPRPGRLERLGCDRLLPPQDEDHLAALGHQGTAAPRRDELDPRLRHVAPREAAGAAAERARGSST